MNVPFFLTRPASELLLEVNCCDQGVVTLERLQSQLLLGEELLLTELLDFAGEDSLGGGSAVDTRGLDRNQSATSLLEEETGIEGDYPSLVGLGNIGEDDIDSGQASQVLARYSQHGDPLGCCSGFRGNSL